MEAAGVEVLGEHLVVVAQDLVHPDLRRLRGRHRGGRARRRRGRRGRGVGRGRARRGARRRARGHRRAGLLRRVRALREAGPVVGPGAGPFVRGGAAGGRALGGVLARDLCLVCVLAAGTSAQAGALVALAALGRGIRGQAVLAVGGRRSGRQRGRRAGRLDQRSLGRLRVAGGEAGDAEHDGHGRGGRSGHRRAHAEQPAAASAYVVVGRHDRDAGPAGQRVQLLLEEAVGWVGHRRPPRWWVVVVGVVLAISAVRSLSRAAEVWLFTVPGLTPRSAAVSSTDRPQ